MKTLPITKKLIGTAEDYSFEERLYHGMLVFMMGFTLLFTIIDIVGKLYMDIIPNFGVFLVVATLYYLARVKKRYFFFSLYLFLTLAATFFYLTNKGIYGGATLSLLVILILALAYTPVKRHIFILLIHLIVLGLIFTIQYRWPQLILDPYKTPHTLFITLAMITLVCVLMFFLIINFLKKSYENERKLGNQQKK